MDGCAGSDCGIMSNAALRLTSRDMVQCKNKHTFRRAYVWGVFEQRRPGADREDDLYRRKAAAAQLAEGGA